MAIAVPLGLPNQEVFLSYNFEANYNSPAAPDYASLGLAGLEKVMQQTNKVKNKRKIFPLMLHSTVIPMVMVDQERVTTKQESQLWKRNQNIRRRKRTKTTRSQRKFPEFVVSSIETSSLVLSKIKWFRMDSAKRVFYVLYVKWLQWNTDTIMECLATFSTFYSRK